MRGGRSIFRDHDPMLETLNETEREFLQAQGGRSSRRTTMPKSKHFLSQPRVHGVRRLPVSSAVNRRIEDAIHREMVRFGVSRSFVIAVACAHALGVKLDENEEY